MSTDGLKQSDVPLSPHPIALTKQAMPIPGGSLPGTHLDEAGALKILKQADLSTRVRALLAAQRHAGNLHVQRLVLEESDADKVVGEKKKGAGPTTGGGGSDQTGTHPGVATDATQVNPETQPVLHRGQRHPQVVFLKQKLVEHGALKSPSMTDQFDNATYRAIRLFQWSYGLVPDGAVGRKTWWMLIGPPIVELDEPESVAAFDQANAKYSEIYMAGRANKRAHGDWGAEPPSVAGPGDYGDQWVRLPSSVKVGGDLNWRYNNPGNILPGYKEHSFGAYSGALNVAALSGLAIFPSWEAGRNALKNLLLSHLYKDLTLDLVFQKYVGTPAGQKSAYGDDPDAYLRSVIGATGLSARQRVRDLDDGQLEGLMDAIRRVEGTKVGTEYHRGDAPSPALDRGFWHRPGNPAAVANATESVVYEISVGGCHALPRLGLGDGQSPILTDRIWSPRIA